MTLGLTEFIKISSTWSTLIFITLDIHPILRLELRERTSDKRIDKYLTNKLFYCECSQRTNSVRRVSDSETTKPLQIEMFKTGIIIKSFFIAHNEIRKVCLLKKKKITPRLSACNLTDGKIPFKVLLIFSSSISRAISCRRKMVISTKKYSIQVRIKIHKKKNPQVKSYEL